MSQASSREGRSHRKGRLPSKPCPVCGRDFEWRKKWERVWKEVKYCSERCRRASKTR
ncbi:DUF2256 domain-containing protein [Henriciella sp. AS95]|uniref:DUF2256 domain-containing protein n=1 Tax=Henriciella sp. AS95 TaxID=3135782 RepID=UPI00316EF1C6